MGRKRMEEPALKSWEEVDSTLKQIREAEIALSKISADAERCMIDIREQAETEAQPYKDKIKRMELHLKGKTKEMPFGRVGFRLSTKLVLPKVVETVINSLKKYGMADCVVVKETVNKEILKTYDEATILAVGASLKKEDTFWYETKQEKIADPA